MQPVSPGCTGFYHAASPSCPEELYKKKPFHSLCHHHHEGIKITVPSIYTALLYTLYNVSLGFISFISVLSKYEFLLIAIYLSITENHATTHATRHTKVHRVEQRALGVTGVSPPGVKAGYTPNKSAVHHRATWIQTTFHTDIHTYSQFRVAAQLWLVGGRHVENM